MLVRAHILVEGMVQGVGYRWFTARKAQSLGLAGHVQNMPDGNVQVEVEGERGMVEELIDALRIGPSSADVRNVHITWLKPESERVRFEIR